MHACTHVWYDSQQIRKNKGSKKTNDGEPSTLLVTSDTVLVLDRITNEQWTREFIKSIVFAVVVPSPDMNKAKETFAYVVNDERLVWFDWSGHVAAMVLLFHHSRGAFLVIESLLFRALLSFELIG